jgi:glycosyltransferase involved in cell wall biosynthesis
MSRPTLEVSMIVKDGAATLGRALASVAPVADRILVGDTGSRDGSIEVARAAGAEVIKIPWEDDFSRARNRVLIEARCDWILSIDADEMLDREGLAKLAALLARPEVDAYDVVRWNYEGSASQRSGENPPQPNPGLLPEAAAFPAYAVSLNTRLFRRAPEIYFEYRVHETVAGRLDRLGRRRAPADFILHHLGQAEDTEAAREAKNALYHRLGLKKVAEDPNGSAGWFELGLSTLEYLRRPAEALICFERARALAPAEPRNSLFCGICLNAAGAHMRALERLEEALRGGLRTAVLFEAIGDAYFHTGYYQPAHAWYSQSSFSPLTQAKMGACETMLGQATMGIEHIRAAIERAPEFAELNDILIAATKLAGRIKPDAQSAGLHERA